MIEISCALIPILPLLFTKWEIYSLLDIPNIPTSTSKKYQRVIY